MQASQQQRMQPFAPASYVPTDVDDAALNEEVKLYDNAAERDHYDGLSVIYSILVQLDFLEKAFVRDSIGVADYKERCARLIWQYKSARTAEEGWLDDFCREYKVNCPLAVTRLKEGKPAGEVEPPPAVIETSQSPVKVAETVQNFITLMDALKLSFRAKDQLHPLLSDLMTSLADEEDIGKQRIVKWLIKVNRMQVTEQLGEDDVVELFSDVEALYNDYLRTLK